MNVGPAILGAISLIACSSSRRLAAAAPLPAPVRLARCDGPATSLPDSLARTLSKRRASMIPDTRWADLATVVPGGFAGIFYDSTHALVLMLTEPPQASAAKLALAEKGLALEQATVRQARWNFAQLVDWFDYIYPRLGVPVRADKDEVLNRIRFSVTSIELRDRVVAALDRLPLPCDLVVVDLNGLTVDF